MFIATKKCGIVSFALLASTSFFDACKTTQAKNATINSASDEVGGATGLGVEVLEPEEDKYLKQMHDLILEGMKMIRDREGSPNSPLSRQVHTKSNGCARAIFEIDPNLDPKLHTGVFQAGARYPVTIRMSPGLPGHNQDSATSSRGLAMKLFEVDSVLGKYDVPAEERTWALPQFAGLQQDFTFLNRNQFPIKSLESYMRFTTQLNKQNPIPAFLNPNPLHPVFHPREFSIFSNIVTQKVDNLLDISYFSQLPYKFQNTAFKFRLDHCPSQQPLPKLAIDRKDPDFLYKAMVETLKKGPVCYSYSIVLQKDPKIQPIEDSTILWPSDDSDIAAKKPAANRTEVGRLTIPQQDITELSASVKCDKVVFNPWNTLAVHKPLGNMNRARKVAYVTGAAARPSDFDEQKPDKEQKALLKQYSAYGLVD